MVAFGQLFSQQDISLTYANTITTADLREHLGILASDALEGRETGARGQKMAAAYIEYFFKDNGLKPIVPTASGNSFLQTFDLVKMSPGNTWIKIGENTYKNYVDFAYTGNKSFTEPIKSKFVCVGEGTPEDYKAIKVTGKNALIYSNGRAANREKIVRMAREQGAENVFIIRSGSEDSFRQTVQMYKRFSASSQLAFPLNHDEIDAGYFLISEDMGAQLMNTSPKNIQSAIEKSRVGKYASILSLSSKEITFYASQNIAKISTENVLGFIEGSDKKNEFVIVTAHYDHLGIDGAEINNGADDDGSGTVAVMEMAQAFSLAKADGHGPRRSMLFMTVTGEEKGLLGSTYYVNNPVLPLNNTVADLNIDMIGRIDNAHSEDPEYIYLIGSDKLSTELHHLSEKANQTYTGLNLDYTYNSDNDPNRYYYRSDHYNFAQNNIPVIFYFNGTHADYHRPTDTIDKIEFELLEKRTKLVFYTAWELANRNDRIKVNVNPDEIKLDSSK